MKYDYVSDLHMDINDMSMYPWADEQKNDILVINGDTANSPDNTMRVVNDASRFYKQVLFTDGNHEHYCGIPVNDVQTYLKVGALCSPRGIYLNGDKFRINDVLFIGACGWYNFQMGNGSREIQHRNWKESSNDSREIRFNDYPDKMAMIHAQQITEHVFQAQKDDTINEIVIFTHTCPVREGLYDGADIWMLGLNGAYGNTHMSSVLDVDTHKKISTWNFGHTHFIQDFILNGVRYINNACGYKFREKQFRGIMAVDTKETFSYDDLFKDVE